MGQARRFTLLFTERFWERLQPQPALNELSFLFAFSEMPPVWWTPHPEASHTITGWVGGPRSAPLAGLDEKELERRACATLAKIFSITKRRSADGCEAVTRTTGNTTPSRSAPTATWRPADWTLQGR